MPMGTTDVLHDQSQYFDQIIQRYDATIAAVFFGHTYVYSAQDVSFLCFGKLRVFSIFVSLAIVITVSLQLLLS